MSKIESTFSQQMVHVGYVQYLHVWSVYVQFLLVFGAFSVKVKHSEFRNAVKDDAD